MRGYESQYTSQAQIVTGRHDPSENTPILMRPISVLQHHIFGRTIQFIQFEHRKTSRSIFNEPNQPGPQTHRCGSRRQATSDIPLSVLKTRHQRWILAHDSQ